MAVLPMFPLGTVLLPHRLLPLHVFEPRYQAMLGDVLDGEHEFGVVLISRGHEVGGGESRTDVGCVARVVRAEPLRDDRWLVAAVGTRRIRVERWLADDPYPRAEVTDLADRHDDGEVTRLLTPVVDRLRRVLALQAELGDPVLSPPTFELDTDRHRRCWQVAGLAPLVPFDVQQVLTVDACDRRLRLLGDLLDGAEQLLRFRLAGR